MVPRYMMINTTLLRTMTLNEVALVCGGRLLVAEKSKVLYGGLDDVKKKGPRDG
ncbi:hypothetical protein M378DRAFT_165767 [Amanita muscaria Koide BX008]|uniref:Uncharacterized protein n=1 Tax=Amanita muscaria (strain Koide BX008) TaxID=946122 RepID=A0A0C2WZV0_AMAMK|nr:hypothetical protein M378DRAFT_165767 [Amanita muscaria Koide BX008]